MTKPLPRRGPFKRLVDALCAVADWLAPPSAAERAGLKTTDASAVAVIVEVTTLPGMR